MKSNQDYKNAALSSLRGHWASSLVATIVLWALTMLLSSFYTASACDILVPTGIIYGSQLLFILVLSPLSIGYANSFRVLHETGDDRMTANMFSLGFSNYLHILCGVVLVCVFVFLWSLLLLIPGIIKSFSYAMTPYILVEHPEMSANQAIDESRRLMRGHKFDLFWLYLSFIGWGILCILTCGIGFLWLTPYIYASQAAFYQNLKANDAAKEVQAAI